MKKGLVWLFGVLFLATGVFAAESLPSLVWSNLVWIFSLGWLTKEVDAAMTFLAFVRFSIAIVTFVVVYELLMKFGGPSHGGVANLTPLKLRLDKKSCLVISIAISLLSSVFFPDSLLFTLVVLYSTAVAFVMIAVPVFFTLLLAFGMHPKHGEEYLYGVRVVFLALAIWLLRIIATWAYDMIEFSAAKQGLWMMTVEATGAAPDLASARIDSTLSTLVGFADVGTIFLVIAIVYNLYYWFGGKEDPLTRVWEHGDLTGRRLVESGHDLADAVLRKHRGSSWWPLGESLQQETTLPDDAKTALKSAVSAVLQKIRDFNTALSVLTEENLTADKVKNTIDGKLVQLAESIENLGMIGGYGGSNEHKALDEIWSAINNFIHERNLYGVVKSVNERKKNQSVLRELTLTLRKLVQETNRKYS